MAKHSISDTNWIGDVVGGTWFFAGLGAFLYAFVFVIRPFPSLGSQAFYYLVLCGLVVLLVKLCKAGFTVRWTEVKGNEGLVIHEGFYSVFWKRLVIPKPEISAVERYDELRGVFGRIWISGIRIRLVDGSTCMLRECNGAGKLRQEVAQLQRALEMPEI